MFKFRIRPGLQKRFIKTLEQKYQKLSPIDHILSRPDSYIGSIQPILQKNFIFKGEQITRKEFPIIPGLYRIIDEILMNAVDNHHREGTGTNLLKIDIKKRRKYTYQRWSLAICLQVRILMIKVRFFSIHL
jgi:DNA gyrase/topoisomerase IV subunit B